VVKRPVVKHWLLAALLIWLAQIPAALALDSKSIFQLNQDRVFQVRVLNRETDKKSSIGSGFIVGDGFHMITNFHVVGKIIQEPDLFYISYLGTDGREGELKLLALDVAHDLALLVAETKLGEPTRSAPLPPRGAPVFAMGNPLDLGLNIAVGTNGGILNQTDDSRILFSGSLNPGMSGGPTFNDQGEVIGINVATARNAISFVVPARFLNKLVEAKDRSLLDTEEQLRAEVTRQLIAYEDSYIDKILAADWTSVQFRKFKMPGIISPTVRCWDNSEKLNDSALYKRFQIRCGNKNNVYLDDTNQFVGDLSYEYYWLESEQLGKIRFKNLYEKLNKEQIGTRLNEEVVSNFNCNSWFINISAQEFKANICRREYVKYKGLSDVLFTAAMIGHEKEGFFVTFIMTGVDYQSTLPLIQKMLEQIEWKP